MDINVLYEVCNRLLKWDSLPHGITDILVDPDTLTVAFWGEPLKLETGIMKHPINNYDFHMNNSFGRLFGIPVEVERWPNSYKVRSTQPMWFHADKDEILPDFLQEMPGAIRDAVSALSGEPMSHEEPEVTVTVIPSPGYPYTPGKTKEIYSAKRKKIAPAIKPPWGVLTTDRDGEKTWAVDYCLLMPKICSDSRLAIVGQYPQRDMKFMVTHCMGKADGGKLAPELREKLKNCEGMLFPSLAVGLIPSTNFGETVLVTRPDIPLLAMKPYKKRGSYVVATYNTDTWTETTGGFLNELAIHCFEQLHGHTNYAYGGGHLYILGPEIKETGFGDEEVKIITATKGLATALQKKYRTWTRDMSPKKFKDTSDLMTGMRYGYLETKVNGVLSWDCFPLAVCPAAIAEKVHAGLKEMGFSGQLITVETSQELVDSYSGKGRRLHPDEEAYMQYQYAWQVRDAILAYAATKDHAFFSVMEG